MRSPGDLASQTWATPKRVVGGLAPTSAAARGPRPRCLFLGALSSPRPLLLGGGRTAAAFVFLSRLSSELAGTEAVRPELFAWAGRGAPWPHGCPEALAPRLLPDPARPAGRLPRRDHHPGLPPGTLRPPPSRQSHQEGVGRATDDRPRLESPKSQG